MRRPQLWITLRIDGLDYLVISAREARACLRMDPTYWNTQLCNIKHGAVVEFKMELR